jgi:rubrerythrin
MGGAGRERVVDTPEPGGDLMGGKPSYLGLLNAVALAEEEAHAYLRAWIDVTESDDVRAVLRKVAHREGEHASSFARRINELGYEVRDNDGKGRERREKAIALVTSGCSDLEKMEALGLHRLDRGDKPDIFDDFFKDHSIDIATGELLGRYIAEERDTGRIFRDCHAQLKQAAGGSTAAADDDRLALLEGKVDELCNTVGELCAAMAVANAGSNGSRPVKSRAK